MAKNTEQSQGSQVIVYRQIEAVAFGLKPAANSFCPIEKVQIDGSPVEALR